MFSFNATLRFDFLWLNILWLDLLWLDLLWLDIGLSLSLVLCLNDILSADEKVILPRERPHV